MLLVFLPVEILLAICQDLEVPELCALARTCRALHDLMENLMWKDYLAQHPRSSITQRCGGSPRQLVAYNYLVDRAWSSRSYVARAITEAWPRMRPVLALSPARLAIGAGEQVILFAVPAATSGRREQLSAPSLHRIHPRDNRRDISAICFLPDGEQHRSLLVARADGVVQRFQLSPDGRSLQPTARFDHPASEVLSLSVVEDTAVTAARSGVISVIPVRSPWTKPSTMTVHGKAWTVHLGPDRKRLAVGTVGLHPLNVYHVTPSGPVSTHPTILGGAPRASAVYGICHASEGSIWGSASSEVLISGWYDGVTRIHDLRQKGRMPCLKLQDVWDDSPVYCVAAGGGGSCHVASGSSRHGTVRLWDVRQPAAGWSAFSPGKDASPVYSIIMESSRLFGITQARAFVMDFDPVVHHTDYPSTPIAEKIARRERDTSLLGEWTPHYLHGVTKIDTSRRPARRDRRLS
ncbi:hypothetical protein CALVIDRAFT_596010 [Calocera viscosa TUFC12733]|uniref:F-box domain-containing protein n=1 Tax=Calocera viscosa (strain TUFC12733) TaxID=1330018 RepID=A0A167Q4R2_CALVF|nr:hypothetical protein CALVIDRAFT_596010 [Calocera viscosa TUFC12733]